MGSGGSGLKKAWSTAVQSANRLGGHGPRPKGTTVLRHRINGEMMDEDTKLVLQMWRMQVMVNYQMQRRIDALERELGYTYVRERLDFGRAHADWRASGSRGGSDPDSND